MKLSKELVTNALKTATGQQLRVFLAVAVIGEVGRVSEIRKMTGITDSNTRKAVYALESLGLVIIEKEDGMIKRITIKEEN